IPSPSHFSPTQNTDEVQTPVLRRSDRQSKLQVRLNDYVLHSNSVEPSCLSEAMSHPNWIKAMNNEIEVLNKNNTWTICDLPPLYQLDVNNVFLYGDLVEDVYMTLPVGYNDEGKFKVCKLNKSLYGLKQAPRHWNVKLTTTLADHGFEQSNFDYSLYTKHCNDKFIALLMYVDDIVIIGNDDIGIKEFKFFLSSKFLIKDLGILKFFMGI
ncbi:ribonuclease H-like domain-containing protein, partial [Tanacetum coccineum]